MSEQAFIIIGILLGTIFLILLGLALDINHLEKKITKLTAENEQLQEQPTETAEDIAQPLVCPECKINDELILISEEKEMWYCDTCKKMIKKE